MATIVCDIDGTLLEYGTRPIRKTIDFINSHQQYTIVIITGRSEKQRSETVRALKAAGVKYNRLLMNPGGMSDNDFKGATARKLSGVVLAIENNPDARAKYREAGIPKVIHPNQITDGLLKSVWNGSFLSGII